MRWGQYCGGEAGGWPHRESEPADLWVHYHHIAETRRLLQRNRIADLADQRTGDFTAALQHDDFAEAERACGALMRAGMPQIKVFSGNIRMAESPTGA